MSCSCRSCKLKATQVKSAEQGWYPASNTTWRGSAMNAMLMRLGHWQLAAKAVRQRMYSAPTPRERERWHAVWRLARGWSAAQVAEAPGAGCPYARRLGGRPAPERSARAGLRADRWLPPPSPRRNRPRRRPLCRLRRVRPGWIWPTGTGRWCGRSGRCALANCSAAAVA